MEKILQWEDRYSVGVKIIDDQHKNLFATINELIAVLENVPTKDQVDEILAKIVSYKKSHFATEEKYFEEFNYEDKDQHIAEHNLFGVKLEELTKESEGNSIALAFKLVDYLEDWLIRHLMTEDQKYVECFRQHGLS